MPGLFVTIVQDPKDPLILPETDGGPPHLTIFWCPKGSVPDEVLRRMTELAEYALSGKAFSLTEAWLNSFTKEQALPATPTALAGKVRHDVLLSVDPRTTQRIEELRAELKKMMTQEAIQVSAFRTPHITAATEWDQAVAEEKLAVFSQLLSQLNLSFGVAYN